MEARKAFRELREGRVRPYYVAFGTETFLVEQFVHQLTELLVEPEQREMAIVRFDTSETALDAIIDEAETPPFLVSHKLILVQDSVLFAAGRESGRLEHRPERLTSYLAQPFDSTVLVFIVAQEKLDERKKLVKAAKAADAVVHFAPLSTEELLNWMVRRAEKQGRHMAPDAAEQLLRRAGTDMQQLSAELDKLVLYAGTDGRITADMVDALVPAAVEQNVFRLTEALAALQTERVMALYHDLLRQREEPIKLLALLVRQFRHMLQVKELGEQGYTPQQMAGQLGLHPFAVRMTAEQAKKFSKRRLTQLLSEGADLDWAMKTGQVDKALGLELFLLRTASAGAG
jgi:DNA polymerase-3 subunit delta